MYAAALSRPLTYVPLAVLMLAGGAAHAAAQATVTGTVRDRVNGEVVVGARVTVSDSLPSVLTPANGRFSFSDLPVGVYVMRFEGPGYAQRTDTLRVMRAGAIDLSVALTPAPYELDPISVGAARSPFLARMGYYDRRAGGYGGFYFDRAAIEQRKLVQLTDLFHAVPGAVVRSHNMGPRLIRFNRATGGRADDPNGCIPDMYIDGLVTGGRPGHPRPSDHDIVDPDHIEGIEVYVGANTPIQYKSECGVILVWTKHR